MFAAGNSGVDVEQVVATVRALAAVDLASCESASLAHVTRQFGVVRGFVEAGLALVAQRADELHEEGRGASSAELLARSAKMTRHEARRASSRASVLKGSAGLAKAVGSGAASSAHADAVASMKGRLTAEQQEVLAQRDAEVARQASLMGPDAFRSYLNLVELEITGDDGAGQFAGQRRRSKVWWKVDEASGMYIVHGELDPELGRRVVGAIEAATDRLWEAQSGRPDAKLAPELAELGVVPELKSDRAHLAAFAFTELLTDRPARAGAGPRPEAELMVLVDWVTLLQGVHPSTVCEWIDGVPVPVSTARRLACDANILPVVLDGEGRVLDLGRTKRLANREQRRALRAMHRTCQAPGCSVPFDRCEIHHILPFERGGPTDLVNLIPLCSTHHHLVHEGGWSLSIDPSTRALTMVRPDGVVHGVTRPGLTVVGVGDGGSCDDPPGSDPPDERWRAARGAPGKMSA